jgi:hypothetical protein
VDLHLFEGEEMTCKHRWEPTNFGIKYRTPGSYWYHCTRCNNIIFAVLKDTHEKTE